MNAGNNRGTKSKQHFEKHKVHGTLDERNNREEKNTHQAEDESQADRQIQRIAEINLLNKDIEDTKKSNLEKAIKIGELLSQQKLEMEHGEFLPWLRLNFGVGKSERTLRDYMRYYRHRDKMADAANLSEASDIVYKIESELREKRETEAREMVRQYELTNIKPKGWKIYHENLYNRLLEDRKAPKQEENATVEFTHETLRKKTEVSLMEDIERRLKSFDTPQTIETMRNIIAWASGKIKEYEAQIKHAS